MGLFDALSAGLGAAAPVGAGLAQGQAQAAQSNVGFLEKLAQMQQQKQAADLQRQVAQSTIGENVAQAAVRNAKVAANNRAQNYLNSNQFKQDVQALRDSADPGAIARISANVAGSEHEEALRPLMQGALTLQKFAPGEGYIDRKTQKIVVPVPARDPMLPIAMRNAQQLSSKLTALRTKPLTVWDQVNPDAKATRDAEIQRIQDELNQANDEVEARTGQTSPFRTSATKPTGTSNTVTTSTGKTWKVP